MGGVRLRRRLGWGLDLLTLGAIGFVVWTLWSPRLGSGSTTPVPPSPVGQPVPVFHLESPEDGATSTRPLHSLVFVFRSDCPVCAVQKPHWQSMAKTASSIGFRSLAVTPEPMTRDIAEYFDAVPGILVKQLASFDALQQLGVTRVPTTLVVDRDGVVRYNQAGVVQLEDSLLRTFR